jgi:hypothetical protein
MDTTTNLNNHNILLPRGIFAGDQGADLYFNLEQGIRHESPSPLVTSCQLPLPWHPSLLQLERNAGKVQLASTRSLACS